MWLPRVLCLCAAVSCCCCGSDSVVEVGLISYYGESDGVLSAPESAVAGEPFVVQVTTYGGGCISAADMSADVHDSAVDLTPYDRREIPGSGEACTLELRRLPHEVELSFAEPGDVLLTVHGRQRDTHGDVMIELYRSISITEKMGSTPGLREPEPQTF